MTLPFFIPPILTAMAWGMLGNPQVGVINLAWQWLTGSTTSPINVYSYGGVVWHMMQYSTPFLFLFIVDAFRAMDPTLEESSRMCGASRWQTFRRITLILMLPAIVASFMLSFIRGIESFESPLFFGLPAGITVITTEIYNAINHRATPAYQSATALSFAIMALMFLLVVWQWRLLRGRSFATVTGKGYAPNVMKLGRWRWVTFAFCILFFVITVVLPVGQLLIGSFFKFFGFYEWDMLTFEHYVAVWQNREFWRAFGNTMLLGVMGASATMVLGGIVAYVTVRTRWRGRRLIDVLAWLPWMMPGMVLGVGFLWGFAMLPGPIPIYGTIWALLLAYMALGTPISVRVHVERLPAALVRSRGMLARPWRQLVADAVAHPDRAGVALVRGRLGADLLRHHARAVSLDPALFRRLRGAVGRAAEAVGQRPGRAGQRDRPADDGAGGLLPLGAAEVHQAAHQHAVNEDQACPQF